MQKYALIELEIRYKFSSAKMQQYVHFSDIYVNNKIHDSVFEDRFRFHISYSVDFPL